MSKTAEPDKRVNTDEGYYSPEAMCTVALIAAAPEMLEALKWACENIDSVYCARSTYSGRAECKDCKIGKAIAKAEGRE